MESNNSFENFEGYDFEGEERKVFEEAFNKDATMIMGLITRRLLENAR